MATIAASTRKSRKPTVAVGTDGAKAKLINLATPPVRGKGRVVTAADGDDGAKQIVDFLKERKFL